MASKAYRARFRCLAIAGNPLTALRYLAHAAGIFPSLPRGEQMIELAQATAFPASSVTSASAKAIRWPPNTPRRYIRARPRPGGGQEKLVFISTLEENTFDEATAGDGRRPHGVITHGAEEAPDVPGRIGEPLVRPHPPDHVRPGSSLSIQVNPRSIRSWARSADRASDDATSHSGVDAGGTPDARPGLRWPRLFASAQPVARSPPWPPARWSAPCSRAIGERPDLVFISVTRPHAGALDDIVNTVASVLHPLAADQLRRRIGGGEALGQEVEETPVHRRMGRTGRPAAPGLASGFSVGGRQLGVHRLARRHQLRTLGPDPGGRSLHLPGRPIPEPDGRNPPGSADHRRQRVGRPRAGREPVGGRRPDGPGQGRSGC